MRWATSRKSGASTWVILVDLPGRRPSQKPPAALAAKYEVQRLQVRSRSECGAVSAVARRDAAFEARLDAVWKSISKRGIRLIEWFPHRLDGLRDTAPGWRTRSRTRDGMRKALKRLYSDRILITKLGRAPTCEESTKWYKEFFTNPPCACNRRAKACTTKCTTCGDCVNKHGGRL